jgi:Flp pilus assembly protein TadD
MFLASNGQLDGAIAEFEAALQRKPKHPEAHYHLGYALSMKGDLEGAKKHYLETLRLDPKAPVHNSLGVVYMKLGQTSEAVAEFNEALRLRPDDEAAAENLRFVLSRDPRSGTIPH